MDQTQVHRRSIFVLSFALMVLHTPCPARAQLVEVSLPLADPAKPGSPAFRKMKEQESQGRWTECARTGRGAWSQAGLAKAWVLKAWLKCASRSDISQKKLEEIPAAINAWDKGALLAVGPWQPELLADVLRSRLYAIEFSMKKNTKMAGEYLAELFNEIPGDDKKSLGRAWALAGELAQIKHDLPAAEQAFEHALKFQDSPETQEKYSAVLLALNKKTRAVNQATPEAGEAPVSEAQETTEMASSELEKQFNERMKSSKRENDLMILLDDCVSYLNALPNGLKSKWAAAKVLEIHQTVWLKLSEPNPEEKWRLVHNRVLSAIEKMDQQRTLSWLPILFRRGDYEGTFRLAEKLRSPLASTVSGAQVLWYGGRSAELIGQYRKSEKYFNNYLELHGGAEQAQEVQLHLALTYLREKSHSSAIAVLERLMMNLRSDRLELSARYWLIRALEATRNPRSVEEARKLVDRFPFSYYGIRLRSELQNGSFEWPFSSKGLAGVKGKFYLNPQQKKAWDRMQWLRSQGWWVEAQTEAQAILPPADPLLKVLLAQELARVHSYPLVIRLLSEAGDAAPDLRSAEIIRLGLPKVYEEVIDKEAKKRSLNPVLVRSLIRQESGFAPRAVSSSNALGLMQLIPPTAREVAQDLGIPNLEIPEDVFAPDVNVQMGTAYLSKLLQKFNTSVPLALAAYNAGPQRMEIFLRARSDLRPQIEKASSDPWDEMWMDELPWAETSYYVKAILRNALLYKTLDQQRISLHGVLWVDLLVSDQTHQSPPAEKTEVN